MNNLRRGELAVCLSALGFAVMPIFARLAYAGGCNVVTLGAVRFLSAATLIWLLVLWRGPKPRVTLPQFLALALLGAVGYTAQSSLYFSAIRYVSVGLAVLLLFTYPTLVTILARLVNKDPLTRGKAVSLTVSLLGLVLLVSDSLGKANILGIGLSFAAALAYSVYILISDQLLRRIDPLVTSAYITTAAGFSFLTVGWGTSSLTWEMTTPAYLSVLGIAFFSTVLGVVLFLYGINLIGPSRASIISTLEPALSILLAVLILNEQPSTIQLVGGAMVIASIVLLNLWSEPDDKDDNQELQAGNMSIKKKADPERSELKTGEGVT